MPSVSSKDALDPNAFPSNAINLENPEQLSIICPICEEGMISLVQLNRHIDDVHTSKSASPSSPRQTPRKRTLKLDLFDDSNGFGLSDTDGDLTESIREMDPISTLSRAHWKHPSSKKTNYCSQKNCKKVLNVKNGIVNCRKCGLMFCNDHSRYKVRLKNGPGKGSVPQYDSFGVFARCCENCYLNKPLNKLGTQVQSRDLTSDFAKSRSKSVAEKAMQRDILQKRFIKLTSLLGENYLWHAEHKATPFLLFTTAQKPFTNTEYLDRLKEVVGHENWQIDEDITHCPICFGKFNILLRKHHCRLCGTIVSDIALNSDDPANMCSLQVPTGIFMKHLPTLNYPPHIMNNWDTLVLLDPVTSRHASLFSFRCCKVCKDTLIIKKAGDDDPVTDSIFATYNELLMLKMHISTSMPRYESLVLQNQDRQNDQINALRARLMKNLKDFEKAIEILKRDSFRLDPTTKKHIPLSHPALVTNIYKLTVMFLQDSLLEFKKINDTFQDMEKKRLSGQFKELDGNPDQASSILSSSTASPSPMPVRPRLTKKQIREFREELMVVNEQKFLVQQQIEGAKKRRKFDEIPALSENVSELEKRIKELEAELGEFGFE